MSRLLSCLSLFFLSTVLTADELPIDPPFSTDGLVLWLDADHHEAEDNRVITWFDRSDHGNHLTQNDPQLRPLVSQLDGNTAIHFKKSSLTLTRLDGFLSGEQTFQVFVLMQADLQDSGSPRIIDLASFQKEDKYTNKRKGFWIGYEDYSLDPDSKGRLRLGVAAGAEATSNQKAWDSKPHVLESVFAGNQRWALYEDGKSVGHGRYRGDVGFLGFVGGAQLTIGQHSLSQDPSHYFQGQIYEVMIFNRVLNAMEQQQVGQYLAKRLADTTSYSAPAAEQPIFEKDIQPLLTNKCVDCHSGDEARGGLQLDQFIELYRGGTSGPILEPGNAQRSFLFHITASGEMPPADSDDPLTTAELELLRRWIDSGATANQAIDAATLRRETQSDHWAFQQLQTPGIPLMMVRHSSRTNIDSLLEATLEKQGLTFSNTASKEILVRRASLDLTGLPPSQTTVQSFLMDDRPDAYSRLLDHLMKSSHFGERWGRHWLDGVGYSDTNSMDNDQAIVRPAKGKWRYRDYVIQSFNNDKPYGQFLQEQLAGDAMVSWRDAKSFDQSMRDHLIATTMLRCAPDDTDQNELNILSIRYHVLQRTAESVAQNILGLSMQCCKCHDHKFEPISQRDYYRFTAIFSPAWQPKDWLQPDQRQIRLLGTEEIATFEKQRSTFQSEINSIIEVGRQILKKQTLAAIPAVLRDDVLAAQRVSKDERSAIQKYLTDKFGESFVFNQAQVMPTLAREKQLKVTELTNQINEINATLDDSWAQAVYDVGSVRPTYVLRRGEHEKPGAEVQAGIFSVLESDEQPDNTPNVEVAAEHQRLQFARQLTDWSSPLGGLAARVRVNRIWQHLFGKGLVETAANFGVSGMTPTHPELLEYLAADFVKHNGQLKPLLKQIMTSQVYMQVSTVADNPQTQNALKLDPDNNLLWRQNLRRMEAEAIRDSVLFVSGRLDTTMGGRFDNIVNLPDGMVVEEGYDKVTEETTWRRSIYLLNRRNYHPTVLQVFDQPLLIEACQQRDASASVSQSLWMLNSRFLGHQAEALARKIIASAPDNLTKQLHLLFQHSLNRPITEEESEACTAVFHHHFTAYQNDEQQMQQAYQLAFARVCQVLFSTNEFIYIQ